MGWSYYNSAGDEIIRDGEARDPDRHMDDRPAAEQLAARAGEPRERFSREHYEEIARCPEDVGPERAPYWRERCSLPTGHDGPHA